MSKRTRTLSAPVLLLAGLAALACAAEKRGAGDKAMIAQVKAQAEMLRQGGGHGFICGATSDGGLACVCREDAGEDDPLSCAGMETVCDWLGRGQICDPDGWCGCHGKPR
ncbi:MAG TPA: hypothetical protein VFO11_12380 [Candidatus Polarisedimenticolaceae bacterium]|nr:hypothetical protein [Candidatus Polarisedimenticolaceae bacterium]